MIKVIIAEDELLVRLGLVSSIDWNAHGYELVGEASNGIDAWNLCIKYKPDLIITDIKMPQMNGLEFIKKIRDNNIETKVIIISCYEDFKYARQAVDLGVEKYILKSDITPPRMTDILLELKQKYWGISKNLPDKRSSYDYERYGFLEDVILGNIKTMEEIQIGAEEYSIDIPKNNFYVMLAQIDMHEKNLDVHNKKQLLVNTAKGLLSNCIERFGTGQAFIRSQYQIVMILGFPQNRSVKATRRRLDEFVQFSRESIKRCLGLTLTIGVSNLYQEIEQINSAYHEAFQAYEMHFILGNDRNIFYDSLVSLNKEYELPEVDIYFNRILDDINRNNENDINEVFNELVQIFKNRKYTHHDAKHFFTRLVFRYYDRMDFSGWEKANKISNEESLYEKIVKMDTLGEVIDYFRSLTFKMLDEIRDSRKFEKNLIISKAQNYIDENYYKEITLDMMSDYLKVNSIYFCKLFSQVTGDTFIDYITKIRITKAQQYLLDTSLRIYEISDKIGYNSPEYFCRVFKKYIGMSPKHYRVMSKIKAK